MVLKLTLLKLLIANWAFNIFYYIFINYFKWWWFFWFDPGLLFFLRHHRKRFWWRLFLFLLYIFGLFSFAKGFVLWQKAKWEFLVAFWTNCWSSDAVVLIMFLVYRKFNLLLTIFTFNFSIRGLIDIFPIHNILWPRHPWLLLKKIKSGSNHILMILFHFSQFYNL